MGLRKIEIKRIDNPNKRQVTFSKRHKGLFKKTAELCHLCDVEAAVITFTPVRKTPYVFGYPNPDFVINRFLNQNNNHHDSDFVVREEAEGMHEEEEREKFWWEQPIDDLDYDGLMKFKAALAELKKNVLARADEMMMQRISAGNSIGADLAASAFQEPVIGGERGNYGGGFNHYSAAGMAGDDGVVGGERGCYIDGSNVPQGLGSDRRRIAKRENLGESSTSGMVHGQVDGGDQREGHGDGGYVPQGFCFHDFIARISK